MHLIAHVVVKRLGGTFYPAFPENLEIALRLERERERERDAATNRSKRARDKDAVVIMRFILMHACRVTVYLMIPGLCRPIYRVRLAQAPRTNKNLDN